MNKINMLDKKNRKIGVTGGNGFIGNNFVNYLSHKGYSIVSFDKESSRNFPSKNIEWRNLDLNYSSQKDFKDISKLIHFAGSHTSELAFEKNVDMLKKTLEANLDNPLTFYLISTYAVFGNRKTPADAYSIHNPLDDYAKSKVEAEKVLKDFVEDKKIKGVVIRPNSLYGKYGKNFIDVIVNKIKNNEKIEMVKFRNQFHHVDDFNEALEYVINIKNPQLAYNIVGEEITEKTLKSIFEKLGINYLLHDKRVRSYWSKGLEFKRKISVEDYLTKAKKNI